MQLVMTGDGSHTLYEPDLDEHYHSTFGAVTESRHVFILNGLERLAARNISILEIGFGTGLNALLTAICAVNHDMEITYHALEKYPVELEIIDYLNYPGFFPEEHDLAPDLFRAIHEAPWNKMIRIHSCYDLHKIHGDLHVFCPDFTYDLIYFDAFSPEKQPHMWTADIMQRLISKLNPGGIFTTYCAKGTVRRMLIQNGLVVERLPGPPGKREMLRGVKMSNNNLHKI